MSQSKVICYYHGACLDGTTAAWVVSKKFPDVVTIEAFYQEPVKEYPGKDDTVIIVDFSYPYDEMVKIIDSCKEVIHIDHHVPAFETIERLVLKYGVVDKYHPVFNESFSGAGLAWKHFFNKEGDVGTFPKIVQYVQDRDLWKFNLPESKHFTMGLAELTKSGEGLDLKFDITKWDTYNEDEGISKCIQVGEAAEKYLNFIMKKQILDTWKMITVDIAGVPMTFPVSELIDLEHRSEQANMMLNDDLDLDFVGVWKKIPKENVIKVRFCSRPGGMNVSIIAKHFGGGGHLNAASAVIDIKHPLGLMLIE